MKKITTLPFVNFYIFLQGGHHPVSSTVGVGHPSSSYGGLGPSSLGGSMHDSMDRSIVDGLHSVEKAPPTSSSNK